MINFTEEEKREAIRCLKQNISFLRANYLQSLDPVYRISILSQIPLLEARIKELESEMVLVDPDAILTNGVCR